VGLLSLATGAEGKPPRKFCDVSPLSFDSFDVGTIFDAPFNPSLPNFLLSPGTSSVDLGLTFDFGPEPDLGNFLVALGQVADPQGNILSAFIKASKPSPRRTPCGSSHLASHGSRVLLPGESASR